MGGGRRKASGGLEVRYDYLTWGDVAYVSRSSFQGCEQGHRLDLVDGSWNGSD
jgi:hypothetical protein